MEIDFLGLNSTTKFDNMEERDSKDAIFPTDTGGVETSLSLSTTTRPSLYCHNQIFSEKKKKWAEFCSTSTACSLTEQPGLLLPPPVFHPSTTAGFLYNLSDKLRKMSEIPVEPASLTMLYSADCANVLNDNLPKKAENSMYITGKNASPRLSDHTRICTRTGYTPTVAMARRATLARFLEQRLHRMNQARTAHLMRKSLNVNKANNILKS